MSIRGVVEMVAVVDGEEIELNLSLPMASLEKLESEFGFGIPKLLQKIQSQDMTVTQANFILKTASQGKLNKNQVLAWGNKHGILAVIKLVTSLLEATFSSVKEGEEGDGKK